jgi:glycine/D-amino acid oxidase-like deaminating enzyme/nitrite reductase/ring-hydroxylating ferredoxin subunit
MNEHAGRTQSPWMATSPHPEFPALTENAEADVCIVGAGIAGLTTAFLLAQQGRSVLVLDDGPVGAGETERTTAHLSNALDDRYSVLERIHGDRGARLAADSHTAAIDAIERIVRDEQIDCDFSRLDGYLFNAPHQPEDLLHEELAAAHRAGLGDVELVDRAPLVSFNTGPALLFPRQGQIQPLKYVSGLVRGIVRNRGRIHTRTHAAVIRGGAAAYVQTHNGWRVRAKAIVLATNTPINDRVAIHSRQRAYRTYVIAMAVPVGTVPQVLYWDTDDPYHYVRLQPAGVADARPARDLLIVGGEDHLTGHNETADARFARLERWTRERFPMAGDVRFQWSGQVMEPVDGLAYIGRNPLDADNVFIATGDSGHGMTHGTIAGLLLTDLIQGRSNRWAELYDPARIPARTVKDFIGENVEMASQYLDWLTAGETEDEAHIAPGSGAIIRRGLAKIAVYRDEEGRLHHCSAICPHLRGVVNWNDAEKTWDCPVHGSRFDAVGHVVNGPANRDLTPLGTPAGK